jgi:hypothetical protein
MLDIPNMTNDRLHCRRGPAGGSLTLSAPALMTMLERPAGQFLSAQAFHHRNAFFVFGGLVESGR